jgi:hypothetical protein
MTVSILDVVRDGDLFARWFRGEHWAAWLAFLAALFALPKTAEQRVMAQRHTGRATLPAEPCSEAWLCCGRRAGKSLVAALICVYLACFRDYRAYLAPGELATVMLLAPDRRQARVVMRYVKGFVAQIPALRSRVVRETKESLEFSNRVTIEIHTTSYRTTRGYTLAAVILEEQAFWPTDECAEPDAEIVTALRPGMTTIPNALLLGLSSPYARKGELWRASEAHFGNENSRALFWNADSLTMNPALDRRVIEEAFERDPIAAASEFGRDGFVQFRSDVEAFLTVEVLERCINRDRPEILEAA